MRHVPSKTTCSRRRDRHGKNPGLVWAMEGRRKEMVMDRIRQEAREMESCMADHSWALCYRVSNTVSLGTFGEMGITGRGQEVELYMGDCWQFSVLECVGKAGPPRKRWFQRSKWKGGYGKIGIYLFIHSCTSDSLIILLCARHYTRQMIRGANKHLPWWKFSL